MHRESFFLVGFAKKKDSLDSRLCIPKLGQVLDIIRTNERRNEQSADIMDAPIGMESTDVKTLLQNHLPRYRIPASFNKQDDAFRHLAGPNGIYNKAVRYYINHRAETRTRPEFRRNLYLAWYGLPQQGLKRSRYKTLLTRLNVYPWIESGDALVTPAAWTGPGDWYLDGFLPTTIYNLAVRWQVLDQARRMQRGESAQAWNLNTKLDLSLVDTPETPVSQMHQTARAWTMAAYLQARIKTRNPKSGFTKKNLAWIRIEVIRLALLVHNRHWTDRPVAQDQPLPPMVRLGIHPGSIPAMPNLDQISRLSAPPMPDLLRPLIFFDAPFELYFPGHTDKPRHWNVQSLSLPIAGHPAFQWGFVGTNFVGSKNALFVMAGGKDGLMISLAMRITPGFEGVLPADLPEIRLRPLVVTPLPSAIKPKRKRGSRKYTYRKSLAPNPIVTLVPLTANQRREAEALRLAVRAKRKAERLERIRLEGMANRKTARDLLVAKREAEYSLLAIEHKAEVQLLASEQAAEMDLLILERDADRKIFARDEAGIKKQQQQQQRKLLGPPSRTTSGQRTAYLQLQTNQLEAERGRFRQQQQAEVLTLKRLLQRHATQTANLAQAYKTDLANLTRAYKRKRGRRKSTYNTKKKTKKTPDDDEMLSLSPEVVRGMTLPSSDRRSRLADETASRLCKAKSRPVSKRPSSHDDFEVLEDNRQTQWAPVYYQDPQSIPILVPEPITAFTSLPSPPDSLDATTPPLPTWFLRNTGVPSEPWGLSFDGDDDDIRNEFILGAEFFDILFDPTSSSSTTDPMNLSSSKLSSDRSLGALIHGFRKIRLKAELL